MGFTRRALEINPAAEADRIEQWLRAQIGRVLHRQGGVLGISGGVDSSVVLALAVRALGPDRVTALILPEKESQPESETLACQVAEHFGVTPVVEDITPALEGFGCYRRRDDAIREVFPDYRAEAGWKAKLTLPAGLLESETLNVFSLTVQEPDGGERTKRLAPGQFLRIMAASNLKQRTRMAALYYHAEVRNYAVIGTANKDEHDQGFFVKYGDGGVDVAPIVHLFKTQVYQLAEYLDVPASIRRRPPTSDTYSAGSTQQEFFFRLPFNVIDVLCCGHACEAPIREIAVAAGMTEQQARNALDDLARKWNTTRYLRMPPLRLDCAA